MDGCDVMGVNVPFIGGGGAVQYSVRVDCFLFLFSGFSSFCAIVVV
jgi:hypothetical protein